MGNSLLIRADASARVGTGHVMRCLALAQEAQTAGDKVVFVQAEATPAIDQRLRGEGFETISLTAEPGSPDDASKTIRLARDRGSTWIIADGYDFDGSYQDRIKEAALKLLLLDDYGHADHYSADYILNQNLFADPTRYGNRKPYTCLLFGTQYVMLRREFEKWQNWTREVPNVGQKVLVTLGGSDSNNVTSQVIDALKQLRPGALECVVVVGGSNPHVEKLRVQCQETRQQIRLVINPTDMPELMAWADIAIAAGGTTAWELAFMGLPSLILVLADNQRPIADALGMQSLARKANLTRVASDALKMLEDADGRKAMSSEARKLVDGKGARRVLTTVRAADLNLRRARQDDCRLLWELANDPIARAVSFSQEPIPWETHLQWFAKRVNSPSCLLYLADNGANSFVGQIRYEISGDEALVSVSLDKEVRGRGKGAALITRGSQQCFADSGVNIVRAYVKPENKASMRAFEIAGYALAPDVTVGGQTAKQFVLNREKRQ
jgi:UDP-2,4-diacetamido-2,4,6-trideoxy-beta-L-altropyranose hydrolase